MQWLRDLRRVFSANNMFCTKQISVTRNHSAPSKRFYKKTGVVHSNGFFEVTLDHRKLKTPSGNILRIENELLALTVAAEWDAQEEKINRSTMHLTGLCCTAQDNPLKISKVGAAQYIINFIDTDTVLFYSNNEELYALQEKEWGAVIKWFKDRFNVQIEATRYLTNPSIHDHTRQIIKRHLLSYDLNSIHGLMFCVESLKSLILTLCCVERKLSVNQAVLLTRLEEEYQTDQWGRVEWAHDVAQVDLQARVAAAVIFIYLNSISESTKSKMISVT